MRRLYPELAAKFWEINAHEHQKEPDGDWTTWLLIGGRGAGKTRAGAEWIRHIAHAHIANDNRKAAAIAPAAIALVAETYADAREVMIEGPSGIRAVSAPGSVPTFEASRRRLVWPDGAVAYTFSAEDPDGIRGYQFSAAWSDDDKSSESALPHFSSGVRDDMAQRRFLEAQGAYWSDAANNPVSSVYGGPMIDAARRYVYAWDARPFPEFPARSDVWGDAANWEKGHWLNGRLARAPLGLLVAALAKEAGFEAVETGALQGAVTGYVVDRPLSARETIDPLADVYQFDVVEAGGSLRFQPRHGEPVMALDAGALAERNDGAFSLSLAQEADLPAAFRLGFFDEAEDFAPAVAEARDPGARQAREAGADIAAVISAAEAQARARSILADAHVMRERLAFSLPPSALRIEPGDAINLNDLGTDRRYRVLEIEDGAARECSLVRVAPAVYDAPAASAPFSAPDVAVYAPPVWELMDLPLLNDGDDPAAPWFAAFSDPWPGGAALYRSAGGAPSLSGIAPAHAVMGRLETALPPAGSGRRTWRALDIRLSYGTLSSKEAADLFAGANAFAVKSDDGGWQVCQFQNAELLESGAWRLSGLLRGQAGTEAEALAGASAGARFVLLTQAVTQASFSAAQRGLSFEWQAGPETDLPDTDNFTSRDLVMTARGLMPLSPVHLRAAREGDDIRLSWIRRTRTGGDSWEGEVPLGELSERYRVTIFDGETPVRTAETTAPEYAYEAAAILADFGGDPGEALSFSVAQISDAVGAGAEGTASVAL
jgi:hypothetical protein